jgi:hypothetical protein
MADGLGDKLKEHYKITTACGSSKMASFGSE